MAHGTCRPRRHGYGGVTSAAVQRRRRGVYDAGRADARDARSNARGGARPRARAGGASPGWATTPSRASSSPARRSSRSRPGCWGSRPPRPTSWSAIRRRSRRSPTSRPRTRPELDAELVGDIATRAAPTTGSACSGAARCSASPRATWTARRSRTSSTEISRGRRGVPRGGVPRSPSATPDGGDRARQARRRRAQLRERRRPASSCTPTAVPGAGRGRARGRRVDPICSPSPRPRGSRCGWTPRSAPGGRGGVLSRTPGGDARVLRAPVRHVGTPGDDQGAAGRRRPVDRRGVRRGRGAVRLPGGPAARRAIDDVRRTKVRLEEYIRRRGKELTEVKRGRGGIRDVEFAVQLLQIVHGRRDPRLREPNTLARARGARGGGLRRRRPTPRRSPTPTGSCAGWSTGCRSSATCRRTTSPPTRTRGRRSRARSAWPTPTALQRRVRTPDRSSCAGSTSGCSTGRCSRRSRDRPRRARRRPTRPPRSCSPGSGSRRRRDPSRSCAGSSIRRPGWARCWRTCSR